MGGVIFDCNNPGSNALLLQCVPTEGGPSLSYSQLPLYGQICVCDADFEKGCSTASQFSKRGGVTDTTSAPTGAPTHRPTTAPSSAPTAAPFVPVEPAAQQTTTPEPAETGKSAKTPGESPAPGESGKSSPGESGKSSTSTTGKKGKSKTHKGKKGNVSSGSMSAAAQGGAAAAGVVGVGVVGVGFFIATRRMRMQRGYDTIYEESLAAPEMEYADAEMTEDTGLLM